MIGQDRQEAGRLMKSRELRPGGFDGVEHFVIIMAVVSSWVHLEATIGWILDANLQFIDNAVVVLGMWSVSFFEAA